MKLKILTESLPIRLLFFIALSLFPPRVTILPYFFRYMVIFYFFTLLVIWPVSGTVQSVVCCTSAPRPAQRVRDGQIYGEWKEYFNTFHKPWREKILFLSYIFKRNGAVKSATSSFLPIRAGGRTVSIPIKRQTNRAVGLHRLSVGQEQKLNHSRWRTNYSVLFSKN